MNSRLSRSLLLPLALLGAGYSFQAQGLETSESSALTVFETRRAPLAISTNGQWRVHVDGKNVLHRVNLLDQKQTQHFALSVNVVQLAVSRTAQKLAFSTDSGCVGIVDFGNPLLTVPRLAWVPNRQPQADGKLALQEGKTPAANNCTGIDGRGAIALSSDGKLLATALQVVDLDEQTVIATLPYSADDIAQRRTLGLQFTDRSTKLFMATATLGEGYEGYGGPSDMQFSIWDLRSKTLYNLAGGPRKSLSSPEALAYNYSPQTGALHFVDSNRYYAANSANVPTQALLNLTHGNLHLCRSTATARLALTPWKWQSYAVDPWGRWIAAVVKRDDSKAGKIGNKAIVEDLQILDLRSGKLIESQPWTQALNALTVTPDGSAIWGLTPPPAVQMDEPIQFHVPGPSADGDVVSIKLPAAALALPKDDPHPMSDTACPIENETPTARLLTTQKRVLKPLWMMPRVELERARSAQLAADAAKRPPTALDGEQTDCVRMESHGTSFVMADQSLWLDRYADVAQIDWRSGKVVKALQTPRTRKVCGLPHPGAGGFINYQGDTVSFQPFDGLGAPSSNKQILEVRRGWIVDGLAWTYAGQHTHSEFRVIWQAKPGTPVGINKDGVEQGVWISRYDASSKRRVGEFSDGLGVDWTESDDADGIKLPNYAPCSTDWNLGAQAFRVESSHFDSFRAHRCADGKSAQTVLWMNMDIALKPVGQNEYAWQRPVRVWATVGSIGVVQDRACTVHIVDIASRTDLGQIPRKTCDGLDTGIRHVRISETEGIVVFESIEPAPDFNKRHLTAYSFR